MLGTNRLYSRTIGEREEVVKHKCRFVAQGFRQFKGLHYEESSSPTLAAASIRMALATAAAMDMMLRHTAFEQAYLLADVDTEIYIELPEEYREFPDAVGKLNKAIYGLEEGVDDKEFRFLRTVIVTAAFHRGFSHQRRHKLTNFFNLPALGRRQPPYVVLQHSGDLCFW